MAQSIAPHHNNKVLIGITGRPASAVAAALLKSQGYHLIGCYIRSWDTDKRPDLKHVSGFGCSTLRFEEAQKISKKLDIECLQLDLSELYDGAVVDRVVHGFLGLQRPNACVECHHEIRIAGLFKKAKELGCHSIATGHFVQTTMESSTQRVRLLQSSDQENDQSYFLYRLQQEQLARMLTPLGGLSLKMVMKLAARFDFEHEDRAMEKGNCIVSCQGRLDFLKGRIPPNYWDKGLIKTVSGSIVGRHQGLMQFAVGEYPGKEHLSLEKPEQWRVTGYDVEDSVIFVGKEKDLEQTELRSSHVHWTRTPDRLKPLMCKARCAPGAPLAECEVHCFETDAIRVIFQEPQRNLVAGQSVVFYEDSEVIGGAIIDKVGVDKVEQKVDLAEESAPPAD